MPITTQNAARDLSEVFDQDTFQKHAEIILRKLGAYLNDKSVRGLKIADPHELTQLARSLMTENHEQLSEPDPVQFEKLIDLYIQTGIQVHSPGYMGRQFSGIIPLAGAIDMIGSIVNQPASFYEAGQLPNVAERIMAREFNRFIGWPEGSYDMVSTSGGALGNLTAILAARNERYPDLWEKGYGGLNAIPAIAVSEDCHYSISRAAGILGIGENQIVKLPIDEQRRIRPDSMEATLDTAKARGLDVFCIVASAGTTSISAIDPLEQIADMAHRRNIWVHVDGAHGASVMVSERFRYKLKGLAKVDSFIMDAHKMLFVPTACTLLFYRQREKAYKAFKQEASYVFDKDVESDATAFDSASKNFECTKRPAITNLWAMWALYGKSVFARKIEYLIDLAQNFHGYLSQQADFEAIHNPELNIVCFRHVPNKMRPEALSKLQDDIRKKINQDYKFFVSKVDIDGIAAIRVVFMNHLITQEHYVSLVSEIRSVGQELSKEREIAYAS
jgi:L-2,4-diaminobutyrate decarboxylase